MTSTAPITHLAAAEAAAAEAAETLHEARKNAEPVENEAARLAEIIEQVTAQRGSNAPEVRRAHAELAKHQPELKRVRKAVEDAESQYRKAVAVVDSEQRAIAYAKGVVKQWEQRVAVFDEAIRRRESELRETYEAREVALRHLRDAQIELAALTGDTL